MKQLLHTLESIIASYDAEVTPILTRPEPQFGDYATNVALQLAKPLGRNPRDIAADIADKLQAEASIKQVDVAGPGFINIWLTDSALLDLLRADENQTLTDSTYVVEYSCPNAFKELHTGHLYQTIAGDIIARLVEHAGATVHRTSFGGDVGLHVAKCLWGMREALGGDNPDKLEAIADDPFERAFWISQCYVAGAGAYEDAASSKSEINELNKTIYGFHSSDDQSSPLAKIYWTTRQWSFDYFAAFYDLLEVNQMRYIPESETMPVGMEVVQAELKKGNLDNSDGAVVYRGDEEKHLHTRVFITSQGLPTYETKDIGVIWIEKRDYNFDKRVLITGNDQYEYMRVVFDAAETFEPSLTGTMQHITNGTVRFGDGSKMSSRRGNVSRAIDVFSVVRDKVRQIVENPELVEDVTLGAIKYVFAKYKLGGDIAFDIEETVSLHGNSGPYLQYAHARARSILSKVSSDSIVLGSDELQPDERKLASKIAEYAEVVERAAVEYAPHHICNYLFELAQEFNRFYENNRVVGDEREATRATLVDYYADRLKQGLGLLGIAAPDRL